MKITVVGAGYVGLSLATLLSLSHEVIALDINKNRVDSINKRNNPLLDPEITDYFAHKALSLLATLKESQAYHQADIIIVATPTNYDDKLQGFDTSSVEQVIISARKHNKEAYIVIKSTVPVGFTQALATKLNDDKLLFSPEFLREGSALIDNLMPTRIIIGTTKDSQTEFATKFAGLLNEVTTTKSTPIIITKSSEAEAIKLFANTYLALRVSYFNELDTYALEKGLSTEEIIKGAGLDPRIGSYYNNPSFGYGGYCLPKDTKQLMANYNDVPQNLISAIIASNETRKEYIAKTILNRLPTNIKKPIVGIYRLTMKTNSDSLRDSSVLGIIEHLLPHNVEIIIYEPLLKESRFATCHVEKDLNAFLKRSHLIVANRNHKELESSKDKVFTRDLFVRD